TTNDVLAWRDEALMLNLAGFGPDKHDLFMQAGIEGLRDILGLSLDDSRSRRGGAEGRFAKRSRDRRLVGAGKDARGRLTHNDPPGAERGAPRHHLKRAQPDPALPCWRG